MQDFKKKLKTGIRKLGGAGAFTGILLCILLFLSQGVVRLVKEDAGLLLEGNKSIAGIQGEKEHTIDLLVVGDSESYTTVSPMQLWQEQGITAYVCGKPGQKIQESYYALKTAFKTQSPKVVLLETNVIYRYKGDMAGIQTLLSELRSYYFPIFRFHDVWKPLLTGERYQGEAYKGFRIRTGVKPYREGSYMKETTEQKKIEKMNLHYMEKIIKLCRENGADLLLYSGPSPVNYNFRKHNGLAAFAKEKGLTYLDLNLEELGINWETDTTDKGDHLNLSGAEKVTRHLGKFLAESRELPDRRGMEGFEEWDENAEKFAEEAGPKLLKIRSGTAKKG